jgi:hypothetical protein
MERRWRSRRALRAAPCHNVAAPQSRRRHGPIPTGLNQPAQGCEERATLGTASTTRINPERVESSDDERPAAAIRSAVRSTLSGLAVWLGGMDPG